VDRVALPFQRVETINAPRGGDMFSALQDGGGWRNKLIWGDNKLVMASLLRGDANAGVESLAGKVDLIYTDPPFDTGADFTVYTQIGDEEIQKAPSMLEQLAYRDTWGKGTDSYLQMMYERLVLMRELLSDSGGICVHLDFHAAHYVKILMDEVFSQVNFVNEIIWQYKNKPLFSFAQHFPRDYDVVLRYVKNFGKHVHKHQNVAVERARKQNVITWDAKQQKRVSKRDEHGNVVYDWRTEKIVGSVWDIPMVNPNGGERLDYATQKPEALVERIISSSSNEGDLVLDGFAGSGTTAAVAEKLGRRWIACDLSRFSIHTTRKRLLELGATFDVLNLGKYERSHWQGVTLGDQLRAYVDFILSLYRAEPVPGFRHLHGKRAGRAVHVGAVDAPITFNEVPDVLAECRETHTLSVDVLGWEWEMGVNQQAPQQAESFGVDLRLYQIPNDVMDRRAKEAEVRFYSLAYLEAEVLPVQARTVQVELKDFVIPDMDLIPAAVRDKISRWSDYIDYWAVDFDYRGDTFCNAWQGFRTRARRTLDTVSATYTYEQPGAHTVLVKVVDIFGIDSTRQLEVTV